MDTTLMPWLAALFILLLACAIYYVFRAQQQRNKPDDR